MHGERSAAFEKYFPPESMDRGVPTSTPANGTNLFFGCRERYRSGRRLCTLPIRVDGIKKRRMTPPLISYWMGCCYLIHRSQAVPCSSSTSKSRRCASTKLSPFPRIELSAGSGPGDSAVSSSFEQYLQILLWMHVGSVSAGSSGGSGFITPILRSGMLINRPSVFMEELMVPERLLLRSVQRSQRQKSMACRVAGMVL